MGVAYNKYDDIDQVEENLKELSKSKPKEIYLRADRDPVSKKWNMRIIFFFKFDVKRDYTRRCIDFKTNNKKSIRDIIEYINSLNHKWGGFPTIFAHKPGTIITNWLDTNDRHIIIIQDLGESKFIKN